MASPRKPASDSDADKALETVSRIIDLIDEEVPEWSLDKAGDFFESVREKSVSIGETITRTQHVTEKQLSALEGMEAGVRKWIKD
jgi:hypothetical protein